MSDQACTCEAFRESELRVDALRRERDRLQMSVNGLVAKYKTLEAERDRLIRFLQYNHLVQRYELYATLSRSDDGDHQSNAR